VIKINCTWDEITIFGVKIYHDDGGCYTFSIRHTGQFNLRDYEKLEFEVKSTRLVRRNKKLKSGL
jgi:hypothetical protein